jgi:hypothetical protein
MCCPWWHFNEEAVIYVSRTHTQQALLDCQSPKNGHLFINIMHMINQFVKIMVEGFA